MSDKKSESKNKFWMIDHVEAEHLKSFGDGWRVFTLILQGTGSKGQIDITQAEISRRADMPERSVRYYYKKFKEDGLIEKRRNHNGRMKYFVSPEYFWNYRLVYRNADVEKIKSKRWKTKTGEDLEVIQGGKA